MKTITITSTWVRQLLALNWRGAITLRPTDDVDISRNVSSGDQSTLLWGVHYSFQNWDRVRVRGTAWAQVNVYDKVVAVSWGWSSSPPPPPVAPTISLVSPQAWQYEIWQSVWPIVLNATTVAGTSPIATVTYRRAWVGIFTNNSPIPTGGADTYTDLWPFTGDTTWNAVVSDGSLSWSSNNVSITFARRIFFGADPALAPDEAIVEALEGSSLKTVFTGTYACPGELWAYKYIARPAVLGQVSDPTSDFKDASTMFPIPFNAPVTVSVTNAYGLTQNYYVYRSVNVLGWAFNILVSA